MLHHSQEKPGRRERHKTKGIAQISYAGEKSKKSQLSGLLDLQSNCNTKKNIPKTRVEDPSVPVDLFEVHAACLATTKNKTGILHTDLKEYFGERTKISTCTV